ncbi:RES family NAD+ phosphorylase [Synechococcus sp. 1G10]|uniref:RES family NAD+ phosphorylase n=1 Tax=Synechococcus sp. 1G10 TaxID=2025605 RepID=UPI0035138560
MSQVARQRCELEGCLSEPPCVRHGCGIAVAVYPVDKTLSKPSSAAIAALELLTIELPDGLTTEALEPTIPEGWNSVPAPESLQALGSTWLKSGRSAALNVPSAVITIERNVLLNPRHPEVH